MTYTRSKEQYTELISRARELVTAGESYRAVRDTLVEEFGCTPSTAHRAFHKAQDDTPDNWGGSREGAGRPASPLDTPN